MARRDLGAGGVACTVPGSSSSSNPLGALANSLIGSSSKTQERLEEIPTSTLATSGGNLNTGTEQPLTVFPGSEFEEQPIQRDGQGSEFLRGFLTADQKRFGDVWDEIQNPEMPHFPGRDGLTNFRLEHSRLQPNLDGPPQRVLSSFLHSFVNSNHGGVPSRPAPLPALGLSEADKQCIRDRTSIIARHLFADKNEDFINGQIDTDARARGTAPGRFPELDEYWNESQLMKPGRHPADAWATEFEQQRVRDEPNTWAHSFERQHGANGWASEFDHEQSQMVSLDQMEGANIPSFADMEQTRMLAHTLAQNNDPKFQNSKFLQFVSKTSRVELTIEDNQVKPGSLSAPGDWATEYQEQYNAGPSWASQFEREQLTRGPDAWANEFSDKREQHGSVDDQWVNEFSKLHVNGNDWADECGHQIGEGLLDDDSDNWASACYEL